MPSHHRPATEAMKKHVHESPGSMTYVLVGLAILAIVTGPILGFPALISHREPIFEQWLAPVTSLAPFRAASGALASHGLEAALMLASIGIATAGWGPGAPPPPPARPPREKQGG